MTPAEQAAAMITSPKWNFASNPVSSINHASTRAVYAYGESLWWHGGDWYAQARYWCEVALRLSDAAGLAPGASMSGLAKTLGVGIGA